MFIWRYFNHVYVEYLSINWDDSHSFSLLLQLNPTFEYTFFWNIELLRTHIPLCQPNATSCQQAQVSFNMSKIYEILFRHLSHFLFQLVLHLPVLTVLWFAKRQGIFVDVKHTYCHNDTAASRKWSLWVILEYETRTHLIFPGACTFSSIWLYSFLDFVTQHCVVAAGYHWWHFIQRCRALSPHDRSKKLVVHIVLVFIVHIVLVFIVEVFIGVVLHHSMQLKVQWFCTVCWQK